jgi:hypothetical protein
MFPCLALKAPASVAQASHLSALIDRDGARPRLTLQGDRSQRIEAGDMPGWALQNRKRDTDVWFKRNGKWQIVHLHCSSKEPP